MHLFVDGLLSAGNDDEEDILARENIANQHIGHLRTIGAGFETRIKAFSYSGYDRGRRGYYGYIGDDTLPALGYHVETLYSLLSKCRRARWVITAYSLGASVAILAVSRLVSEAESGVLRVPRLTLIAPALYGAPLIGDPELRKLVLGARSPFGPEMPPLAQDFDGEQGYSHEVREALVELLNAGVDVTIVYSPEDEFAPYPKRIDERVCHVPMPRVDVPDAETPFRVHFLAKSAADIHALVHYLAKPFLHKSPGARRAGSVNR
jgi:pimeloyl-ACP methyl ester carboxylesterase